MAYFKDHKKAIDYSVEKIHDPEKCFLCAKQLDGPTVEYQGYLLVGTMLMHRDCAFAMANRIISDCWVNRREGKMMQCDK